MLKCILFLLSDEGLLETLMCLSDEGKSSILSELKSHGVDVGFGWAQAEGSINPEEVKKDRIMRLVSLVNDQTREKSKNYLGKTIEILCEDFDEKKELYLGRDEYGRMGYFSATRSRVGEFVKIRIDDASGVSLTGEIVE